MTNRPADARCRDRAGYTRARMQPRTRRAVSRAAAVFAVLVALLAVYQLYIAGNPVLAAACAGGFGLAIYVYTARGMYTYRYLFPGLARSEERRVEKEGRSR